MISPQPAVSLIIPTHNRSAILRKTIHSLSRQSYPCELTEVIVVADGCTDDTVARLRDYHAPFSIQIVEQSNQGAAAARNHGGAKAQGELLIFLDDDIEAAPQLIEAHVRAHQLESESGRVALGYLSTILPGKNDFFEIKLRGWWEAMFEEMRKPGYRFNYTNLLSGNFSLEARLFAKVGGFDTRLRCHEDYELGYRLLKAGAVFTFAENALGYHHEFTDLDRSLQRKYQEGIADVALGQRTPELRPTFLMARLRRHSLLPSRILFLLAFRQPAVGDRMAFFFQWLLAILEKGKMRYHWQRVLDGLMGYWYWRGAAKEIKTEKQLDHFLSFAETSPKGSESLLKLDLRLGLEEAESRLDETRPPGAEIYYGNQEIGQIPASPGAEPLSAVHLRPFLAKILIAPLLRVLAIEGVLSLPDMHAKIAAKCDEEIRKQKLMENP